MLKNLDFYIELYRAKGDCYIACKKTNFQMKCFKCEIGPTLNGCTQSNALEKVKVILTEKFTEEELFELLI